MRQDDSAPGPAPRTGSKPLAKAAVLQVIGDLEPHGTARATLDVARSLVEEGARSLIASAGGALVGEARIGGSEHIEIALEGAGPLAAIRAPLRLFRLIEDHGIDILHIRSSSVAGPALRAARRAGILSVSTVSAPPQGRAGPFFRGRAAIVKADRVIAISDYVADRLRRDRAIAEERLSVIHRGIDLGRFNPAAIKAQRLIALARRHALPDDKTIVLAAGRLASRRGFDILVDALTRLDRDDIYCLILGSDERDGEEGRALERRIEAAGLGGRVRLGGHVDDMPAAYMLADVVTVPSRAPEAFARVCVEALAMGRPVVASAIGAATEAVVEGRTGWLVAPEDPAALAQALEQAVGLDADGRREMAFATRSLVRDRFDRSRMCAEELALYRRLLRGDESREAQAGGWSSPG